MPSPLGPAQLTDVEARQASWANAAELLARLRSEHIDITPLSFGILRLADLAMIDFREARGRPMRKSTLEKRLAKRATATDEYMLIHGDHRARRRKPGAPSRASVLAVLSALAWHLEAQTNRPSLRIVVALVAAVFPPIHLFRAGRRPAWRLASDAISKYRAGRSGEDDFEALDMAMKKRGILPT